MYCRIMIQAPAKNANERIGTTGLRLKKQILAYNGRPALSAPKLHAMIAKTQMIVLAFDVMAFAKAASVTTAVSAQQI